MVEPLGGAPQPAEAGSPGVQMAAPMATGGGTAVAPQGPTSGRGGGMARAFFSVLLIVLGVLCLTLSPVAIWGRNLILDTNHYVETVKPLASNPGVQDAVVAQVDTQVEAHLDVAGYVKQVLPARAATLLAQPIQSAAYGLIHTITTKVVQSKAFVTVWVTINRVAHRQVVSLLTGDTHAGGILVLRSGKIYLDLSAVVRQVKDRLVTAGLTIASRLPVVGGTLEIAQAKGLESVQSAVRALNTIADWLPWIGLALVGLGIWVARRHRRALIGSALGLCAGMIVLGIALMVLRHEYVTGVPSDVVPQPTSAYIFDTLVRYLRWGIRAIFVVGLLVALGVWLGGPSSAATSIRRGTLSWTRGVGEQHPAGAVSVFVYRYTNPLRIAIIALGGIILLLTELSAGTIILLAVIVVLLLLAVEALRAPVAHTATK
jgi:LPXTG-motif cell wall-anchored protein